MRTALFSFPVIRWALALTLLSGAAFSQEFSQIRVGTRPAGAKFVVDGVEYSTPQSFLWARGTKHTLGLESLQVSTLLGQRLSFSGWETAGKVFSTAPNTIITADPSISEVIAGVKVEYQVRLYFTSCPDVTKQCPASNGRVFVNGVAYYGEGDFWQVADTSIPLQAEPFPGFVFSGWSGVPIPQQNSSFLVLKIDRPLVIRAHFDGATPVLLKTVPQELDVYVDRARTRTTQQVDWAQGVQKLLSAPSPQRDENGAIYIFDGWEGLPKGQNVTFTPKVGTNSLLTMTARFVPGAPVSVYTEPAGLRVKINNQDIFDRNYSFYAPVAGDVLLEAPADQLDASGRKYVFAGWTNNGSGASTPTASFAFAVPLKGLSTTAKYRLVPRLVVDSSPSGRMIQVEGKSCRTPCMVDKDRDQSVMVSAPRLIPVTADSRYEFTGWADSDAAERPFLIDADFKTVLARYEPAHRVAVASSPAQASTFAFEPASGDGYYRTGTTVMVTASSRPGYKFRRWEGDLEGTFASGHVQVSGPRSAMANFDLVPFADPAGVRNAAGDTPLPGVAPGSVGAMVGLNLASSLESGPASPLAQSLGGVVVRLGSRLMPLFWVSPERIEFQVPSDLEPGHYQLTVMRPGQTDTKVDMDIVWNNPGLYTRTEPQLEGGVPLVKAFRPNGSEVTLANPAQRGEEIVILGTGFGRYDLRIPDGFALPSNIPYKLVDSVSIKLGEQSVAPSFAGGHELVGLNSIRFIVPDVASGVLELRAVAGGRESNLVSLPVQ